MLPWASRFNCLKTASRLFSPALSVAGAVEPWSFAAKTSVTVILSSYSLRMDTYEEPWLLKLATVQREVEPVVGARYDETQQLTLQGENLPLIDQAGATPTKKADREVGEDQKAHW